MLSIGSAKESWFFEYPEGEPNSKPQTLWNLFWHLGRHNAVDDPEPTPFGVGVDSLPSQRLIHMPRIPRSGGKGVVSGRLCRGFQLLQNEAPHEQP